MKLQGKSIVVTGASSGMGRAIVERYVREGANVIAVARRKERLDELVASLANEAGKVIAFQGDVSKLEDNENMIDFAVKEFGKLDLLVNNAGIMDDMSPIGDATDDMYERVMRVNVYGPMCAMRKAVKVFLEQGNGGNIINVVSEGAYHTCAGAIYCASKAALTSMTKNTAFMYMEHGIRCNAIAPGGIATEIATSMGMPNMAGYARAKKVIECSPAPGSGEQIAGAATFLASEDSSYVNGDVLMVDGGWCSM
ncbi:MAG: SDR family oxidoreductase [Lachnospiraceae bacterium]|nr:SDR family oxidoreductase [Lachnospira sp.]MBR6696728.1 SDR family oxidoreductase [Lachnospiraceae bacterium]